MPPTFDSFELRKSTLQALHAMGYTEPTPVQQEAIPRILAGKDLIAQARTGTGKTAAFGVPLVDRTNHRHVQSVILTPTRELANQVAEELNRIGKNSSLKALAVYGGVGYGRQKDALSGRSDITCIVACPGRLKDLLTTMKPDLSNVHTVVLDEADRMLDMGFRPDIEAILEHMPKERQTIMTSATMPQGIRQIASRYLRDPETVQVSTGALATPLTDQFLVEIDGPALAPLIALLEKEDPERAVVFADTKHTVKRFTAKLQAAGYKATALQGNMSQSKRDKAMAAFKDGRTRILVATDVAARGIDVEELTHVIQFDMPQRAEDHVHRTGRTGRAGNQGRAFLFAQPGDSRAVREIEKHSGVTLKTYNLGPVDHVPDHVFKAGPAPRGYESIGAGGKGGGNRGRGGRRGGGRKRHNRSQRN